MISSPRSMILKKHVCPTGKDIRSQRVVKRSITNTIIRYQVTKLISLFIIRELAQKTANSNPFVIINTVNPGLCYTDLTRSLEGSTATAMKVMRSMLAWSGEEGSRTLVHATTVGQESHGVFISGCKIPKYVSPPVIHNIEHPRLMSLQQGPIQIRYQQRGPQYAGQGLETAESKAGEYPSGVYQSLGLGHNRHPIALLSTAHGIKIAILLISGPPLSWL